MKRARTRTRPRRSRTPLLLALLIAGFGIPIISPGHAGASPPAFTIATSPSLSPAFSPTTYDYVETCGSSPTQLSTTGSGTVTVGGKVLTQPASQSLSLTAGQEVTVTSNTNVSYYIRCLPSDFPAYTVNETQQQTARGYLATPDLSLSQPGPADPYVIAFDRRGVPVWWRSVLNPAEPAANSTVPSDAKFLDPSTIAWWINGRWVIHSLDGSVEKVIGQPGTMNLHDFQRLPDGTFLVIESGHRGCPATLSLCLDLSSWGLSAQSDIVDDHIVQLDANGNTLWTWDPADHIRLANADTNWHDWYPDIIHMNSLMYDGHGGVIFSARHLDAVYRVDMASSTITWKLGGTPTPQSLTVLGQGASPLFSGQHYAHIYPDGTLSVSDNGTRGNPTGGPRPPQVLEFTLDPIGRTATVTRVESDARIPSSACCGGAQRLATGNWIVDWGASSFFSEYSSLGVPLITVNFAPYFSYRVAPVSARLPALRSGMDAQVPALKL